MVASLVKKRINLSVNFNSLGGEFKIYIYIYSSDKGALRNALAADSRLGSRGPGVGRLGNRDSELALGQMPTFGY